MDIYLNYAKENKLSIKGLTNGEIKYIVDEHASTSFFNNEKEEEKQIKIDSCSCGYYTVGNSYCNCGEKFTLSYVEGNLLAGFNSYTESF